MAEHTKARRRLRSSTVILGGMGALAAALTSCGSEPDKRCVDRNSYDAVKGYRVIDSKSCKSGSGSSGTGSTGGTGSSSGKNKGSAVGGKKTDGQWYYGSDVNGRYADSGTFSHSTAVNRGGFGCSGSSGG
ncbi:hypothetical protein OEIGOIKO_03112 [Streptomyces chrestomyceticus JCM 4735]|uniref:Lipoprotein n=1 Tax=Streptomyces chrestomyceticus JCM 4735 TaxID=1306181 RepID=A0A7U9KU11_9ACTN|nr:hypothetical protein [Streptomyces chrestomyceticus]GCD35369.1 hypothetical protein OEIGOIKO_03112 [Streptomyces chrestomyceticus JCM 4735]